MLHFETVEPDTLAILKKLMTIEELHSFSLVGWTALSFTYGHRISDDLDLFSERDTENSMVEEAIHLVFGSDFQIRQSTEVGIFGFIRNSKVDLVHYPHPWIRPIRMIVSDSFFLNSNYN